MEGDTLLGYTYPMVVEQLMEIDLTVRYCTDKLEPFV